MPAYDVIVVTVARRRMNRARARFDNRFPERFPGIAITEIGDLGYGLNISFSDGHNRGIYPKAYLLSLAGV